MNKPCHMYEYIVSNICMGHVTHMSECEPKKKTSKRGGTCSRMLSSWASRAAAAVAARVCRRRLRYWCVRMCVCLCVCVCVHVFERDFGCTCVHLPRIFSNIFLTHSVDRSISKIRPLSWVSTRHMSQHTDEWVMCHMWRDMTKYRNFSLRTSFCSSTPCSNGTIARSNTPTSISALSPIVFNAYVCVHLRVCVRACVFVNVWESAYACVCVCFIICVFVCAA